MKQSWVDGVQDDKEFIEYVQICHQLKSRRKTDCGKCPFAKICENERSGKNDCGD